MKLDLKKSSQPTWLRTITVILHIKTPTQKGYVIFSDHKNNNKNPSLSNSKFLCYNKEKATG